MRAPSSRNDHIRTMRMTTSQVSYARPPACERTDAPPAHAPPAPALAGEVPGVDCSGIFSAHDTEVDIRPKAELSDLTVLDVPAFRAEGECKTSRFV